jgi:hypothetical protein
MSVLANKPSPKQSRAPHRSRKGTNYKVTAPSTYSQSNYQPQQYDRPFE